MGIPFRAMKVGWAFFLVAAIGLTAGPLSGQKSTTRGLNLGFHLQGASLAVQDGDPDGGGGAGFRIGYGVNRIITLYFEADGVSVDSEGSDEFQGTWTLAHADLGVRFHFASTLRSWVPYLDVAIGGRGASVKDIIVSGEEGTDVSFSGGAFSFGGGIYAYFKQTLALDVGLKFSGGKFTEVDVGAFSVNNLDIDANSTRFKIGIVWWP